MARERGGRASAWALDRLDERLELREPVSRALGKPVTEGIAWYYSFGGLTFLTFVVLAVAALLALTILGVTSTRSQNRPSPPNLPAPEWPIQSASDRPAA